MFSDARPVHYFGVKFVQQNLEFITAFFRGTIRVQYHNIMKAHRMIWIRLQKIDLLLQLVWRSPKIITIQQGHILALAVLESINEIPATGGLAPNINHVLALI